MSTAPKHPIAFHLGRTLGAVVRFCLHDENSRIRWVKRVLVFIILALSVTYSWSAVLSALLSIGCVVLVVAALLNGKSGLVSAMLKDDESPRGSDDSQINHPFYGEHEHPDYKMYFKD